MVDASSLPQLVLRKIIGHARPSNVAFMCYWKCGFDLLAVCRRWRNVAKELIYCSAHIEKPAQPDDFACSSPDGFYTSLDLICANHQLSTVKHLSVDLQTADFITDFEHTNMLIGNASAAGLPKVTTLTLFVYPLIYVGEGDGDDDDGNEYDNGGGDKTGSNFKRLHKVINCFVELLPNIAHIDISLAGENEHAATFATKLMDACVDHLRSLKSTRPITVEASRFNPQFERLTTQDIFEEHQKLPLIPTQSIQSLDINNLPREFAWQTYFYGFDSTAIVFPKLQELRLGFSMSFITRDLGASRPTASTAAPARVQLPALKSLKLFACPHVDTLFGCATINPHLQSADIVGPLLTLQGLRNTGIVSINRLNINICDGPDFDAREFADSLNYFYGQVRSFEKSSLTLSAVAFDFDCHEIRWTHLQMLGISASISFTTVVRLIPCMPALRFLDIGDMLVDQGSAALLNVEPENVGPILPATLSQTIKALYVKDPSQQSAAKDLFNATKYLVIRIPTLSVISVENNIVEMVKSHFEDVLKPRGLFKSVDIY